ncbi:MAG: hypothetical protein WCX73_03970 [Candidatus Pacearchaeota archaeon]|jgi:hypothetical protein
MFGLTEKEEKLFRSLDTPGKIQDFLNKIPFNFDYHRDTCASPRKVLIKNKCHCIEGAIFAALCLKLQGYKPLVLHMAANKNDLDHVIAVFKKDGFWGAISKTKYGVLRYREPVYRDVRELVMSYFHEYTDKKGENTLRKFSIPVDLSIFDNKNWATNEDDLWYIDSYLDKVKHFDILTRKQIKNLRKPNKVEIKINNMVEWKPGKRVV